MPFPSSTSSSSSLSSSTPRCHLWFYLKSKILKSDVGQEGNVKQDDTGWQTTQIHIFDRCCSCCVVCCDIRCAFSGVGAGIMCAKIPKPPLVSKM